MHTVKKTEASRTELGNTVNNAKAIDKTLYTEDYVKALETAITNAEAVLAKENASETEVAAAKKAVQDAIDALQKKDTVDKDKEEAQKALSDAVTKADAVYAAGQGQYTKESWDAFEKAYKAAKEAGADLTAAALKDLTAALEKAQAALKTAETPDTEPNPTPTPAEKKLAAPTIKSVKASAAKAGVVVKVIVNAVEGADHYDIWVKPLADGRKAVACFNRADTPRTIELNSKTVEDLSLEQVYSLDSRSMENAANNIMVDLAPYQCKVYICGKPKK